MNKILTSIFICMALLLLMNVAMADVPAGENPMPFYKITQAQGAAQTKMNLCNWSYWFRRDGYQGRNPINGQSGGTYPRGTAEAIYQEGLVYGGIVRDTRRPTLPKMRVGGQTYRIGTNSGHIITPGTPTTVPVAADANQANIYRVRWDWEDLQPRDSEGNVIANPSITDFTSDIVNDIAELNFVSVSDVTVADCQALIDQYEYDWNNWPWQIGAPYYDVNGNGIYDPPQEIDLNGDGQITIGEREEPGIANADQVIWWVMNDVDDGACLNLYGSYSIGLELQVTAWCYNQPSGTLGQLFFKKYLIINKSGFRIDSMFVAQWCDPDLGDSGDDFVGSDEGRSLGYAYNGVLTDNNYDAFNLPPAAAGYDFFQGPIVQGAPTDTAIFNLQYRPGYRNLPMTAFGYFAAGSTIPDPDLGEYAGTLQWYNLLNGYQPIDDSTQNTPFLAGFGPNQGQPTFFPANGDPVNLTGDIDGFGDNLAAGDRRMSLSSGPFTMLDGDTQEVVVAVVGGIVAEPGGNNRNAVAQLKLNDDFAQFIFDNLFQGIPSPPQAPDVKVVPRDDRVMLEWGSNLARVASTESRDPLLGFNFEGYNVYQLPQAGATLAQGRKVATFDLANNILQINGIRFVPSFGDILTVPIQKGTDTGIQRYFVAERDYINDQPMYAGNEYYFAVTAYNAKDSDGNGIVDDDVPEPSLESALNIIAVVPQSTTPGQRFPDDIGEPLEIDYTGPSDGNVFATVIDPTKTTGQTYEVFFVLDEDTTSATYNQLLWSLRYQGGSTLIANQMQATTPDAPDIDKPIIDGVQWVVTGPSLDAKLFEVVANNAGPVDPSEIGCFAFNNNGFPFLINALYPDPGTDRPDGARQQTNGSTWGFNAGPGTGNTYAYFVSRCFRNDNFDRFIPFDYEMRFTAAGGFGSWAFTSGTFAAVPFELWNIGIGTPTDDSDDYRMIPWVLDEWDENDVYDYTTNGGVGVDHTVSGGDNDPYLDWVYWIRPEDFSAGTAGYDAFVAAGAGYGFEGDEVIARTVLVNWNGGDCADPTFPANVDALLPEEGTIFRITSTKPSQVTDVFRVTAPAQIVDPNLAAQDVERINVFPNPYYGGHSGELDRFDRFVTFNHMPQKATIRIFSLSGTQVRKLEKDSESQFFKWDLLNEANLPVASGMYIVYIDMPDLGKEKVLKVMIVQGEEVLEFF